MTAVWALDLPTAEKFVLLALADNANDDGTCWPSVATICAKTSLAERTVRGIIHRLEEMGQLSITERYGRSNVFNVTPAANAPLQIMQGASAAPPPLQHVQGTPAANAPTPALAAPITIKEPSREPKSEPARASRGTESEADIRQHVMLVKAKWPEGGAYEDWITAERLIRNLVAEGTSWETIEAGVERYGKYCKATRRIVANPGKWFAEVGRPWLAPWAIPPKPGEKHAPNHDAAWSEAKTAAKAINFRAPIEGETAASYMTAVHMAMNVKPAVPLAERRGLAGVKRVPA